MYELLPAITRKKTQSEWIDGLARLGVPCSPVNTVDQVFADPQVRHREMQIRMPHPLSADGMVDLIGNPIKFSETPVDYRLPPPSCGQHTDEVLKELLGMPEAEIAKLRERAVI
jgi:crotonobetainyl-CoA:carnitine CoA-transferase CaiB-like acyl-CoA transferase